MSSKPEPKRSNPEAGDVSQESELKSRQSDEQLQPFNDDLDLKIQERTSELVRANQTLHREIKKRVQVEEMLRKLSGRVLTMQDEERRRLGISESLPGPRPPTPNFPLSSPKPPFSPIRQSQKSGPYPIFCTLPCSMKPDSTTPWIGMSEASVSAARLQ
jgi:hypothetical protein